MSDSGKEERVFDEEKRKSSLVDDASFSRTQEYTSTLELVRLLYHSLVKIIECWENFDRNEIHYFDVADHSAIRHRWNKYLASIEKDLTELRFFRRSLLQRIEMFDNMRNG
ncbi:MAG: hypothetical protein Q9187_005054, partial [Circinaria calcarea]